MAEFGWAHSLAMDATVKAKFTATPDNVPFVMHACEGLDNCSSEEIFELERLGALDRRSVLVHGLALNAEGVDLLNRREAALVWCPRRIASCLAGRLPGRSVFGRNACSWE